MTESQYLDPHNHSVDSQVVKDWERFQDLRALSESGNNGVALAGFQELATSSSSLEVQGASWSWASLCLRNLGRLKEARETLKRAFEFIDEGSEAYPWLLYSSASIDVEEGNWKSASTKFDALLSDYSALLHLPENQSNLEYVNRKRGVALLGLDRAREALPLLEHAFILADERELVAYCLGKCYYVLGDFQRAEKYLRQATELHLDPSYAVDAHYHLGLAYYRQYKYAWAIKELEWCLRTDVNGQVPRNYVLKALINAARGLGLEADAERYSQMLG